MFRSRGENHRSTYILLFLNVAFFLLQYQDGEKFVRLFGFERSAVAAGQLWRLFTYQFMQAGRIGIWNIPPAFVLFLNLILLTLMGTSIEEEWGTAHFVRFYLLSSVEHTGSGAPPFSPGVCQQFRNTTDPNPALRALLFALDEWVTKGTTPPKSEVPREGTAVFSVPQANGLGFVPQEALGWPNIPGVTYTGVITVRHLFNWGDSFDEGILTNNPPAFSGPVYPSFVSRVDKDGNEVAGIRLPPVEAPIATTSGWGLRAAAFGGPDGCESSGQWIPFATTRSARLATGDPRKSLEERYKDHDGYVKEVTKAAEKLEKKRLLLPSDVKRYIDEADASHVLR